MIKTILTVFKKEMTVTLRDSRTLVSAILLPAIIFPLMIIGLDEIEGGAAKDQENKQLKIALVGAPANVKTQLSGDEKLELVYDLTLADAKAAVEKDSLDAAMHFDANFLASIENSKSGELNLFYKSNNPIVFSRVSEKVALIEKQLLESRMSELQINSELLSPVALVKQDIISPKEKYGELIGTIFPIIFITFCFIGCMYPAIDLITGEKERGTIETLLTAPVSRFHILIGKMMTISVVGLVSALLTIAGMIGTIYFLSTFGSEVDMAEHSGVVVSDLISLKAVVLIVIMLVPLAIFFAGMLAVLVVNTKNFKESQSVVTPMTFLVVAPVLMAMSPGMELNWHTVWYPIFNMSLAMRDIIDGTMSMGMYALILFSLVATALMAAFHSYQAFSDETVVLK